MDFFAQISILSGYNISYIIYISSYITLHNLWLLRNMHYDFSTIYIIYT